MGQKDKLIKKLRSRPKTFTFDDMVKLLGSFGMECSNKGKTSGSRVMFTSKKYGCIRMHKPYPQKELKSYQVKQLLEFLEKEHLI